MTRLPILAFHSVGDTPLPEGLAHLTASPELFERCMQWLARQGYTSLTLGEVHAWLAGDKDIPPKSLCLLFDDGYLDNWCFAHPILAKYDLTATVLITPEFVRPDNTISLTLANVEAGEISRNNLPGPGFLSWEELRAMKASGHWDIQSHFQTHTWLPISDRVIGYHNPQSKHYWMAWNANPEEKPFWMSKSLSNLNENIPWGTPIYENARSQIATAVHPNPNRTKHLVEFVEHNGGESFFSLSNWESILRAEDETRDWESNAQETSEERRQRILWECQESKRLIESNIPNHSVSFLAWPGGEWDATCQEIAVGPGIYTATRTTRRKAMQRGDDPSIIHCGFFGQKAETITGTTFIPSLLFRGWVLHLGGNIYGRFLIFLGNRLRDLVGFLRRPR